MSAGTYLRETVFQRHENRSNRFLISIDEQYDAITKISDTIAYGSVHLFRLRNIPELIKKFWPLRHDYLIKNLIRHPVNFIWSGNGELRELFNYDLFVLNGITGLVLHQRDRAFLENLSRKHNINLAQLDVLSFLGAAANLYNLRLDLGLDLKAEHIKMEEITTSPSLFRQVATELTGSHVTIDDEYIDTIFTIGPVNQHKSDNKHLTPEERYETFSPWQKESVNYYLEASGILTNYKDMGYDFSFLQ